MKPIKILIYFLVLTLLSSCLNNKNNSWIIPLSYQLDSTELEIIEYEHLSVSSIENNSNPFISVYEKTTYELEFDSLLEKYCDNIPLNENSKLTSSFDSIYSLRYTDLIGLVPKYSIIRYDSLGPKHVIIYKSAELEDISYGYWIAISDDKGISWQPYYSGLTANFIYHIKPMPIVRLFQNDSIIQLEAAIVKLTKGEVLPTGPPAEYQLIKDHLLLSINLNELCKDSDGDGLTDIIEKNS